MLGNTIFLFYSDRVKGLLRTFISNDVCVKNRGAFSNYIDPYESSCRIVNFEDIGVQIGRHIYVYCTLEKANELKNIISNKDDYLNRSYKLGNLKVYTCEGELEIT